MVIDVFILNYHYCQLHISEINLGISLRIKLGIRFEINKFKLRKIKIDLKNKMEPHNYHLFLLNY
jgi:hypothetical protein